MRWRQNDLKAGNVWISWLANDNVSPVNKIINEKVYSPARFNISDENESLLHGGDDRNRYRYSEAAIRYVGLL